MFVDTWRVDMGWVCVSVGSIQCVCGHGVGLCECREYTMCLWTHGEWTWGGFV